MKLKPGLLQLVALTAISSLMSSFIAACSSQTPLQQECDRFPIQQRPQYCPPSSSGGNRSGSGTVYPGSRNSSGTTDINSPNNSNTTNKLSPSAPNTGSKTGVSGNSPSSQGRGGFGSFGRGSSAGT